jgi:hypothetical protein
MTGCKRKRNSGLAAKRSSLFLRGPAGPVPARERGPARWRLRVGDRGLKKAIDLAVARPLEVTQCGSAAEPTAFSVVMGTALIVSGVLVTVLASVQYMRRIRDLRQGVQTGPEGGYLLPEHGWQDNQASGAADDPLYFLPDRKRVLGRTRISGVSRLTNVHSAHLPGRSLDDAGQHVLLGQLGEHSESGVAILFGITMGRRNPAAPVSFFRNVGSAGTRSLAEAFADGSGISLGRLWA